MARFGRSRANTDDSNYQYNSTAPEASGGGAGGGAEPVAGFAASAAAGGVAASMMPPAPPPPRSGATASGGGGGGNGNKRGGQRKQKSITSGISTLFRRQPSPAFDDSLGSSGRRDPSGVHATRDAVQKRTMKKGSSKKSGRGGAAQPASQQQQQPQQSQQQYSQAQRDLLHSGAVSGTYDQQQQQQTTAAAISPNMSGGASGSYATALDGPTTIGRDASGTLLGAGTMLNETVGGSATLLAGSHEDGTLSQKFSGATSLSQEFSTHNRNNLHQHVPLAQPSYESEGTGMYSADDNNSRRGRSYDSSSSSRGQAPANNNNNRRSKSRSRSRSNRRTNRRSRSPITAYSHSQNKKQIQLPRRYRGFSTSISSLFLDESIVCGAFSCCGLLLSSRTEHLLNERNVKRGLTRRGAGGAAGRGKEGGRRAPSRILGVAYVVSILGVLATYAIWGFDDQNNYEEWYDEFEEDDYWNDGGGGNQNDDGNNNAYYNNDDGNANANDDGANNVQNDDGNVNNDDANQDDYYYDRKLIVDGQNDKSSNLSLSEEAGVTAGTISTEKKHCFNGILKLRDHKEYIIDPAFGMASQAYMDLMTVFEDNGFSATAQLDRQLQQPPPPPIQQHRLLEDASSDNTTTSAYDQGQQARTVIIILFLFLLGVIGRRRRMRTRFAILRSRAQDDHLYYASVLTKNGTSGASGSLATPDNTVMENFHEREDKYDGACSHTLFGCYPVDSVVADYADYHDDDNDDDETTGTDGDETVGTNDTPRIKKRRKGGDFMGRTMTTIFHCCCGKLCQCWCQFFSICSLAQEAREARLLLPPSMQRIDLITHQPFAEYAKDVNNVRRRFMERGYLTWVQHYAALSRLSRYILLGFVLIVAFVVMTMVLHPMGGFDWGDALVLIATFTQSFLVLVIVFGIFHRSDLSFDAVVKFFAVGFVICVPVGFVLEGIVMNGFFSLVYLGYYLLHWMVGENFDVWLTGNHRVVWMLGELFNAYFIAALVEELCKYYGFRFVEHPDLIFLTGLDRSAEQARGSGGLDSYMYDSQLVSNFSRNQERDDDDGESVDSRGRRKWNKRRRDQILREDEEEEPDLRTLQQQAAAITTGMISVAVGLACAENFLYVFFLGGTGGDIGRISGELAILIFRSIFPVHALSAAMQSINMIRKFIEEKHGGTRNIGVGRIIFPAILLHGTFDAILMCVNAYIEASWDSYYENGGNDGDFSFDDAPYNILAVNLIASLGIIGVMAASFGWYTYQNKLQMLRLASYDMKTQMRSGRGGFNAPNLV